MISMHTATFVTMNFVVKMLGKLINFFRMLRKVSICRQSNQLVAVVKQRWWESVVLTLHGQVHVIS